MQDLNDLAYYVHVVDKGGFAPASRALHIPKSKLSRRVAALEARLGVRLIQRTTRQFAVTDLGRSYYDHCKAMMVEAEAAQEMIETQRAEPRGVIRLSCPIALLHAHVSTMLAEFMARCPNVTLLLDATNRRVDLVSEGIDMAIRVRPPPLQNSDLVMRVLADRGQCLVASPTLVEKNGFPATPAELQQWPSLGVSSQLGEFSWTLYGPEDAQAIIHHTPVYVTTDMLSLRDAALTGVGVVQLPLLMVQKHLNEGSLVRLMPAWAPRREIIHVVFPTRRGLLPAVRALVDFLAERFTAMEED